MKKITTVGEFLPMIPRLLFLDDDATVVVQGLNKYKTKKAGEGTGALQETFAEYKDNVITQIIWNQCDTDGEEVLYIEARDRKAAD